MPLRAVLFDAVGTLFRVRGSVGVVYASVAARHGADVDAAALQQSFVKAFAGMRPLCFPGVPVAEIAGREYSWWKTVVAATFTGIRFDDFDAFFHDLFEHFGGPEAWQLFPDTLPTMRGIRRLHGRVGIVSNFDGRLLQLCDGLGLTPHVDSIVMSSRVGFAKPDPRIFRCALSALDVRANETLHVGDSRAEDVEGARAAGLRAVLIDRDGEQTAAPDCVAGLGHILDLVRS
jgi:putative hydrolase of the HAD superfamily